MGCVIGVVWVVGMVKKKGLDDGNNAYSWAWIDVVSILGICGRCSEVISLCELEARLADHKYSRSMQLVMSSWSSLW